MESLLAFFIILAAGLVLSELFRRLHLPYVTALILGGVLIGPYAMNLVQINETIAFLGAIGIVFLMFIAGTEVKLSFLKHARRKDFVLPVINGGLPFSVGFLIAHYFGYDFVTSLIVGVVFISSSIAVIIPSLEASGLMGTRFGKTLTSSVIFEDIGGLILLAMLIQSFTHMTRFPLPFYLMAVVAMIVFLYIAISRLQTFYLGKKKGKDLFESELRFVFVMLVGTVILFEALGMHSIVAGFIIGILLSDSIRGKIEEKIRIVSYGIFIPVFFLIIGMEMDLSVLFSMANVMLVVAIVSGSVLSKIVSGWIGGRIIDFSNLDSLLIGVATTPSLSTTLAAAFLAMEFGLLTHELISSLIILTIITTFLSPTLVKLISVRRQVK